ncbi:MAG: hypothetical protein KDA84_26375 [Planctomycetaceae bacterium]|nr:hypothetical protein [Planctomycetaceae bacterium]
MVARLRSSSDYLVDSALRGNVQKLAHVLFQQTCRSDFSSPGFSLLPLGCGGTSRELRELMLRILDELSRICQAERGAELVALSMSRFNQQTSTKPHRDGGPTESLLLLGYEPTSIVSHLAMADYSQCAHDLGLTPAEFLEHHNPMFPQGGELLADYTTDLTEFDPRQFQILLINNSVATFQGEAPRWQGVLHQATIPHPDETAERVVNSIQLTPAGSETSTPVTVMERERFVKDDALGSQYGRT